MIEIQYNEQSERVTASTFLDLVNRVWPGDYDESRVKQALQSTIHVSAWHNDLLVGCVRMLTDGYFFSTITEILVDPAYQKLGIGKTLMELIWEQAPSTLSFGVQAGNEGFFEKLGYERGLDSYQKKKDRNPPTS